MTDAKVVPEGTKLSDEWVSLVDPEPFFDYEAGPDGTNDQHVVSRSLSGTLLDARNRITQRRLPKSARCKLKPTNSS